MARGPWKDDPESRAFVREAEALVATTPELPPDPFAR
jgi:hypothetical protein